MSGPRRQPAKSPDTMEPDMSNRFNIMGSFAHGIWSFRVFGYGLQLKAPWWSASMSERYGYIPHYRIGFGWRFRFLWSLPECPPDNVTVVPQPLSSKFGRAVHEFRKVEAKVIAEQEARANPGQGSAPPKGQP